MENKSNWTWETDKKEVADIGDINNRFPEVHEFSVSDDGEKIAVPVKNEAGKITAIANGEAWPGDYEKLWYMHFGPDGRLTGLGVNDDQWTVIVDGEAWEEKYEYVWNTRFSEDGKYIGVQAKRDFEHTISVNGKAFEKTFLSSREFALSPDGQKAAALVQVEQLAEADIFKFLEGTWSVAVNGVPWEKKFVNVWGVVINPHNGQVAAQVRLGICEFTIAVDDKMWDERFASVWQPAFRPGGDSLIVPAKVGGGWTLVEDGKPIWDSRYAQLWYHKFSPDAKKIGAIVALEMGRWTVAIDDKPWKTTFKDLVIGPVFSEDGLHAA
ncbi:MAG: WD40 repeat domain-containing protein, partial [bacterium]